MFLYENSLQTLPPVEIFYQRSQDFSFLHHQNITALMPPKYDTGEDSMMIHLLHFLGPRLPDEAIPLSMGISRYIQLSSEKPIENTQ